MGSQHVTTSAPSSRDETFGFFGPGSQVWRVDREVMVLLGSGTRALLMQVAHPLVAAAVVEHSRYATDPMGRLRHTLEAIYGFAFDERSRAEALIHGVARLHARVRGTLPEDVGAHTAGARYSALTPELLLWVYATLIDSSLVAYTHFVGSLTDAEQEEYYAEMRHAGPAWDIPPDLFPASLPALRGWMGDMLQSGQVAAGPQAREIARVLMRPPARWIPGPAMLPTGLAPIPVS